MRKSFLPIALITTALTPLLGTPAHADIADPTYFAVNMIIPPDPGVPYDKCEYAYSLSWTSGTN